MTCTPNDAAGDPAAARARLWQLLGVSPPGPDVGPGTRIAATVTDGVAIERWTLALNPHEPVPALLTRPLRGAVNGMVLYHHAHGHHFAIGKDELLHGRPALHAPYAAALAARGWAAIAIDHWGFGERSHTSERMLFKRWLWAGVTLLGLRVQDAVATIGWVRRQREFASLPLVAMGLSMGGTLAWWSAALDPRIDAVVDLCCLSEFEPLLASGGYDLHAEYFFVPGLLRHFSAVDINALIAPRPHLSLAGRDDPLTPPAGLARVDDAMRAEYSRSGAADHWRQRVFEAGHQETAAMRDAVLAFLDGLA